MFFPTLFKKTRHCYLYNTRDKKTLLDVANGKAVCRMSQMFSTIIFYKNTNPATLLKTQFSILCRKNIYLFHALGILSQIDFKWATIHTNHETLQWLVNTIYVFLKNVIWCSCQCCSYDITHVPLHTGWVAELNFEVSLPNELSTVLM